jgi:hypothetical protein
MIFCVVGVLSMLYGAFASITAPGTNTINLGLMSQALHATIWGFGLLLVGMLMRRPPAT